jgi:predicted acyl esterase
VSPRTLGARRGLVLIVALAMAAGLAGLAPAGQVEAAPPPFAAHGSVNQVWVVDLTPGVPVELLDAGDAVVASGIADSQGAYLFRQVPSGGGYRVRQSGQLSAPLTVSEPTDHPDDAFYDAITIPIGYGYLPTRDGTTLSVNVSPPLNYQPGKRYPVLVNYSGYDPSAPGQASPETLVFTVHDYFVVGVNMRGTGCSGGAFDYFETLQSLDGYDVIEALARQSWSNGDVGMVGISYPGISQLFVAATRPPHLRAITPLSVIADTVRSTLYPGGILNSGFALGWATDRVNAAKPAAAGWAKARINNGDTTCAANQKLRLQSADLLSQIQPERYYEPRFDALAPRTFVNRIQVPVYLSGSFQDEQTGGHFSTMVDDFDPSIPLKVTLTNGTHVEPLGPEQLTRVLEFVDFYVGRRIPMVNPLVRFAVGDVYTTLFGAPATLPPDRFIGYPDYGSALAAYEAEPKVRVLWENGGTADAPGMPLSTAETTYADWPVPGAVTTSWYLDADGRLSSTPPTIPDGEPRGVSSYTYSPSAKPTHTFSGSTEAIWQRDAVLDWEPLAEGTARSFVTDPFAVDTAIAGMGSVDLWLRSGAPDTDLEVTITEVRPDGQERYVQSGWLRARGRALDEARSTELEPFHTFLEADAAPMPAGQFVPVRIALFPFAHVFREGSRLRLNIEAPGGNQPFWEFTTGGVDGSRNDIAHSIGRPSRLVLPVLPASLAPSVPTEYPACPSVRNQPCREYRPDRIPTGVTITADGSGALVVTWSPPPSGGEPTAYRVDIEPESEGGGVLAAGSEPRRTASLEPLSVEVGGDVTSYRLTDPVKGVRYRATVQARYGEIDAPVSNASLPAAVEDPAATTTTTSAPGQQATGGQPPAETEQAAEHRSSAATGVLPVTGVAAALLAGVALALVSAGVALNRSGRARSPLGGARRGR